MLNDFPIVAVIMSSYNGEKYLAEQLDSILAQEGVRTEIFIRDDGSSDRTLDILSEYAAEHTNIHVHSGENIKCGPSFIQELKAAEGFRYYAFSDQDDYWLKDKLSSAVSAIDQAGSKNIPVLYYSNLVITDEKLHPIHTTRLDKRVKSFGSFLLRRSIPGCAMAMNAEMRAMLLRNQGLLSGGHDTFALFAAYTSGGIVLCDPEARILYRQHGNNTAGSPVTFASRVRHEWRKFFGESYDEGNRARDFLEGWKDRFDPDSLRLLKITAGHRKNLLDRLRIIFSPNFRTGDWRLTLMGKIKALLGRL
ncbi:MAG: glycosyltransferase [Synergistaceae bacterium]|nr:glycosyltransferase [Synergistaceae bacterium]